MQDLLKNIDSKTITSAGGIIISIILVVTMSRMSSEYTETYKDSIAKCGDALLKNASAFESLSTSLTYLKR